MRTPKYAGLSATESCAPFKQRRGFPGSPICPSGDVGLRQARAATERAPRGNKTVNALARMATSFIGTRRSHQHGGRVAAFYNEIDPYPAQWMRNLIDAGRIAPGTVDERSISDLEPNNLDGFTQAHFFAGIGVWSYALRLAGWPDDAPVWTGSCPCQPFSAAGKRAGHRDERHLWPAWLRLIRERRPPVVFGEQVASRDGLDWIDAVQADLEAEGYAVGALDLCAAGVGAPHIRQRIFFVAESQGSDWEVSIRERRSEPEGAESGGCGGTGELADAIGERDGDVGLGATEAATSGVQRPARERERIWTDARECGATGLVGDSNDAGSQGRRLRRDGADECAARQAGMAGGVAEPDGGQPGDAGLQRSGEQRLVAADRGVGTVEYAEGEQVGRAGQPRENFWWPCEWIACRDGKTRPTGPGIFPLAHGATARLGRLRAYGNAIVAPLAAEFVRAYMDTRRTG